MKKEDWIEYWKAQKTPLHASTDACFVAELSREIAFHIGDHRGKRVLELGCGDGGPFEAQARECRSYTGVDFSESLISRYREKNPDLNLVQSDALSFLRSSNEQYDIIFSYGVLQYLDGAELSELFSLQAACLDVSGRCVHFGIPVKELASSFHAGIGSPMAIYRGMRRGLLQKLKSRFTNKIGNWHSMRNLYRLSVEQGFNTRISSNIAYFYRINLVQQRA